MTPLYYSFAAAMLGLVFVAFTARRVLSHDEGNDDMRRISKAIQDGAYAFLIAEYQVLVVFVLVVALVIAFTLGFRTSSAFILGAFLSALAGAIGMGIAVRANGRTAAAAQLSLDSGLRVAFGSGTVMGMAVVSLSLLGLAGFALTLRGDPTAFSSLAGFGFGASSIALFARVGGGIFTKGADVGADLVGKVERNIPEDDPRNPAVIADNVGDNVGDVAGMGADLFESYSGSIIAAAALGISASSTTGGDGEPAVTALVTLPFLVAAVGIVSSLIGTFLVHAREEASQEDLLTTLRRAVYGTSVLALAGVAAIVAATPSIGWELFWVVAVGLAAGNIIGFSTEYYTSYTEPPTRGIAASAHTGSATVIIEGLAVGMTSTVVPTVTIVVAVLAAYALAGLYGVALAAVGMLATLGVTLATDAYGPVADNAGGIAEMAGMPAEVRHRTDALDSLGNTTAATGKGFAIGSAVLTALALLAAYTTASGITSLNLLDPLLLGGLLLGAMLPYLFSALTMRAVGATAMAIVVEVRRQFHEIPGLAEGTAAPDYRHCVDISTRAALRAMVVPGVLAVVAPISVGFLLGAEALAGLLIGATSSGFLLALMMANAGGAWDNAKKWIETGEMGGKGTAAHHATVVGDTVGDPFKDTSGPALNILIKLMSIVSLVFAPLLGAGLLARLAPGLF